MRILCVLFLFISSCIPANAGWFEDTNWRMIVDFTSRDINDLPPREVARLRAAAQIGMISHCGGLLSAVLVEIEDEAFVFTNRHGAISGQTSSLFCDEAQYRDTLRYFPDIGLSRHDPATAGRALTLAWPPINISGTFIAGEDADNSFANDWMVFRLAPGQRDPRRDALPFRLNGTAMTRGGMSPVTIDTELAAILPGTSIGLGGDYDNMRSVFTSDCEMQAGGIRALGTLISLIYHQCDTFPGSSGSALALYDPEAEEFRLMGLNAASSNFERADTQATPLNRSNLGPHVSGMLERIPGLPDWQFTPLRDEAQMSAFSPWPPVLPPPPDERWMDRQAIASEGRTINVRAGLGTDTDVRGLLGPGQYMVTRQCVLGWCEVAGVITTPQGPRYTEGFASASLLEISDLPPDRQRPYHYKGGEQVVVVGDGRADLFEADFETGRPERQQGTVVPGDLLWVRECSDTHCAVFGPYSKGPADRPGIRAILRGAAVATGTLATAFGIKSMEETLLIARDRIELIAP